MRDKYPGRTPAELALCRAQDYRDACKAVRLLAVDLADKIDKLADEYREFTDNEPHTAAYLIWLASKTWLVDNDLSRFMADAERRVKLAERAVEREEAQA